MRTIPKMFIVFTVACGLSPALLTRSVHRGALHKKSHITTKWKGDAATYTLHHENLEPQPFFTYYDEAYFNAHLFPEREVQPRNPRHRTIDGATVSRLLEELVDVLQNNTRIPRTLDHFVILKKRDYNPRRHAGLIILRCKDYPLVIKLFMETPQSLASPFSKGFEQSVFFIMGGGVNRHLSGFSRIPNAEAIREIMHNDPHWSAIFDVPRKWFWLPHNHRSIEITAHNLGPTPQTVTLPAVYAIMCDAIETDEPFHLFNKKHRARALELCSALGICVDPHINNFMVEQDTQKLVLVDSECFSEMVGLRKHMKFTNYPQWYAQLCVKCLCDGFGRTKQQRRLHQGGRATPIIPCKAATTSRSQPPAEPIAPDPARAAAAGDQDE